MWFPNCSSILKISVKAFFLSLDFQLLTVQMSALDCSQNLCDIAMKNIISECQRLRNPKCDTLIVEEAVKSFTPNSIQVEDTPEV